MPFLSFLNEEKELSMLIDIGNGTITVALALFSNKTPEFIYSSKRSFPVKEKPESAKLLNNMVTLLDSMLNDAVKSGLNKQRINRVIVSLASPWNVFLSKEVHISEDKPFTVTKSFLEEQSLKEEKKFKKELALENPKAEKHVWSVIEKSIIHTRVNGYILDNSLGKKTKALDVFMYLSAVTRNVEEKIIDKISNHTHIAGEKILIHTFPLVSFSTIRNNLTKISDFLLIDITGESTDISFVKMDVISQNTSFPIGRNSVIRHISKHLKVTSEVAESSLNLYLSKKTDAKTSKLIQKTLIDIEKEWFVYMEDSLTTIFQNGTLPREAYVTVDEDVAPIFVEYFKSFKFETIIVNEEKLRKLYRASSEVKPDQFVILLADFYNTMKSNQ